MPAPSGFTEEGSLGYLVTTNAPGTRAIYECEVTSTGDYFSSVNQTDRCEGNATVRLLGYIYTVRPGSEPSAILYRCDYSSGSHYDSLRSDCEATATTRAPRAP